MLHNLSVTAVPLLFIAGVVLLWQPGSIDVPRWYGALAIGAAVALVNLRPDHSNGVIDIRTPKSEIAVRVAPTSDADTAQEISTVEPGDELHVVTDTVGWVGFREYAHDQRLAGYVPKEATVWIEVYENKQEAEEQKEAEQQARRVTKQEAIFACQEFIRERLKAPSTAEFGWSHNAQYNRHNATTMTVHSHVDAENALGATLRSDYRCKVTRDENTWKLLDLQMDQR